MYINTYVCVRNIYLPSSLPKGHLKTIDLIVNLPNPLAIWNDCYVSWEDKEKTQKSFGIPRFRFSTHKL